MTDTGQLCVVSMLVTNTTHSSMCCVSFVHLLSHLYSLSLSAPNSDGTVNNSDSSGSQHKSTEQFAASGYSCLINTMAPPGAQKGSTGVSTCCTSALCQKCTKYISSTPYAQPQVVTWGTAKCLYQFNTCCIYAASVHRWELWGENSAMQAQVGKFV